MSKSKWAVVVVVGCLVVTAVAIAYAAGKNTAVPVQEVVRAKRFELVDEEGGVRGALRLLGSDPALEMLDAQGVRRAALFLDKQGVPTLALFNEGQRAGVVMDVQGHPSMRLYDVQGKARVGLGVAPDGSAGLGVADAAENLRVGLGVAQDGIPNVGIYDERHKPLWEAQ